MNAQATSALTPLGLVYAKAVRLRDLCGYSVGELVNICTNDGQRVFDAGSYSSFVYVAVVTTIAASVITSLVLSPAALLGCLIFLLTFPLQVSSASLVYVFRPN